jgi:hypothetical protein
VKKSKTDKRMPENLGASKQVENKEVRSLTLFTMSRNYTSITHYIFFFQKVIDYRKKENWTVDYFLRHEKTRQKVE